MESHRTRLNFVRTAVLTSTDGGNTFDNEEQVEHVEEADDKVTDLFEQDRAILANRGDKQSLYEQLQANKEKADEEWAKANNPFQGPKTLDSEEIQFLEEQKKLKLEKEKETKKNEQAELNAFKLAQAKTHVVQRSTQTDSKANNPKLTSKAPTTVSGETFEGESDSEEADAVLKEKKSKKRKKHKHKKDKKSKKAKSLVNY